MVAAADRLTSGRPDPLQNNMRVLSSLLSQAFEDGLITMNVALKPGKFLPKVSKRRQVNPFTREEVSIFLAAAECHAPRYYPLFLCAVRTVVSALANSSPYSGVISTSRGGCWSNETTPMAK